MQKQHAEIQQKLNRSSRHLNRAGAVAKSMQVLDPGRTILQCRPILLPGRIEYATDLVMLCALQPQDS